MENIHDIVNDGDKALEPWGYNLAAVVLFLIGFFGFSLNLFVIVLMCRDVKLWTPMNIILFNLVCSDFLVSIFGNPFTLIAALSHKWIFGSVICIAYGFFMSLLGITSITTLTVLAYERYCLVKYPLSSSHKISNNGAVISVFFIWLYSLALTLPPLFGWGAYVHEAADISCSVNWETQTFNATTYIIFLFIFGLVIPVIVISFSYINIILTMKKNSDRLGRKNRAEKRITQMVAVMIFAFITAWTPYASFALIEQFGPSDFISPQMAVLPALIAKSSICYNPLIYVGLNTQFRASWKRQIIKESTALDTTLNQISQTSESFVVVDCRPKLCRQSKKEKLCLKAANKLTTFHNHHHHHHQHNQEIKKNIENQKKSKTSSTDDITELKDINNGKINNCDYFNNKITNLMVEENFCENNEIKRNNLDGNNLKKNLNKFNCNEIKHNSLDLYDDDDDDVDDDDDNDVNNDDNECVIYENKNYDKKEDLFVFVDGNTTKTSIRKD